MAPLQNTKSFLVSYLKKFRGQGNRSHPFPTRPPPKILLLTFVASFSGIALCASLEFSSLLEERDLSMLVGSFGATAVLIYATIDSPLAQPRNVFFGHVFSALWGVCIAKAFAETSGLQWLSSALAVAGAISIMQVARVIHPPGGATALIAVTGSKKIMDLGFLYVAMPIAAGAALMLLVALLFNNLLRDYPLYYLFPKPMLITNTTVAVAGGPGSTPPRSSAPSNAAPSTPAPVAATATALQDIVAVDIQRALLELPTQQTDLVQLNYPGSAPQAIEMKPLGTG